MVGALRVKGKDRRECTAINFDRTMQLLQPIDPPPMYPHGIRATLCM